MKKTFVRIFAFTLVCVMLVSALASCSKKISGSYESEVGDITYTFSGSKVEIVAKTTVLGVVNTNTFEGEYEIVEKDDETMEIIITLDKDGTLIKSGTYTFEEGEDYIKIGIAKYTKVEK